MSIEVSFLEIQVIGQKVHILKVVLTTVYLITAILTVSFSIALPSPWYT